MSISSDTPRDNLTLTEADLAACRPISNSRKASNPSNHAHLTVGFS